MTDSQLQHTEYKPGGKRYPVCILAHDITDPLNVGSLFRLADALGLEKIYLSGDSARPPDRKLRKTSRSAENHVAYEIQPDPHAIITALKSNGYKIVALEITTSSMALDDFVIQADDKICLIPGAENTGVNADLLAVADAIVHIPMQGNNSSMNLATACSIVAYDIIRRLHG